MSASASSGEARNSFCAVVLWGGTGLLAEFGLAMPPIPSGPWQVTQPFCR